MKAWRIKKVSESELESALNDDWEPFGLEPVMVRGTIKEMRVWCKMEVEVWDTPPPDNVEE